MRFLAPVVVFCLLAVGHAAPLQTLSIAGKVVDPAGGALPGVAVELRQGATVRQRTTSDANGDWRFEKVAPGDYRVRMTMAGFVTTEAVVALREAAPPPVLTVVLKVGVASETVVVQQTDTGEARNVPFAAAMPAAPPPPGSGTGAGIGGGSSGKAVYPGQYEYLHHRGLIEVSRPDTASYAGIQENRFRRVLEHPLSTFSVDVDTASYANVRRFLNEGRLPPPDAVRIEELINYFKYDYAAPQADAPVSVTTEIAASPWNPKTKLALVGLRSAPVKQERTPPRNLTFLLDVSGSMTPENRLPLVKTAMRMLVDTLRPEDRVAIVVYAGASGVVLQPTSGDRKHVINSTIADLRAGGSTNGAAGIELAYDLASGSFARGGINRVILATDGDFNVGVTSQAALLRLIEEKRERGIFLSVLGVGDNNLKDSTMEMLADKGNGNYSYLDSIQEARRVLIAEAGSTLVTVAKDVKLQIEFNPRFVAAYRLVGYENRILRKEDFNNDRKDAGEMGAGHAVTALYEIVPAGEPVPGGDVDPLKYQQTVEPPARTIATNSTELMNIKIRYKVPLDKLGAGTEGETSRLLEFPVRDRESRMTANLGFAAAVAEFGMLLRRSEFMGSASWQHVLSLAREHRGSDPDGYRAEFIRLADLASALDGKHTTSTPDLRR
ncbi:MAG TPA: von Willebrand factor type A domain-containing protein [Vicinamibacterales bacterium]|nr:von Willebrand factor type A domain-containing protein [Vicinamibacterales bacterium]